MFLHKYIVAFGSYIGLLGGTGVIRMKYLKKCGSYPLNRSNLFQ